MTSAVYDVVVIGAGAAGLMAGIWAGRTSAKGRHLILDGARTLGAKILVAGGGRCNVTHDTVSADAYAGASPNAIRKVLTRFDVPQTVAFFRQLGVLLKRESTGKLFPTTNSARTVLNALLSAVREAGVTIEHPQRVEQLEKRGDLFTLSGQSGSFQARRVILATGGKALPKSGSDGQGYALASGLGHTLTPHIFPALVPLILAADHPLRTLSGLSAPAVLDLWSGTGKHLIRFTDALLCTHFGLSGPAALDMSRYYTAARREDSGVRLTVNWLPERDSVAFEGDIVALGKVSLGRYLSDHLPERLARLLCQIAAVDPSQRAETLLREQRRALVAAVTRLPLPVTGDRGFTYAEVTAGGVPLTEIRLETMESRLCSGVYLCGEICDVDGRIGGYNFQWAWASGYTAGVAAGRSVSG
ncbi:MAG TPA: aminoacetone oxidase family FAD-binding enzyme [Aggregatilineales bacterium]|nr:aminoacetone oxidase family FAD-binding enzyme [Anaerolineales bacterium]HRE46950.1 aminoacetone oxidase family FAD-binding enzyme [Aggregatilineales bacterium]